MGSHPLPQLFPFPRPLGVFTSFVTKQSERLTLKNKVASLPGNSFDVSLANGQPVFKVKGEGISPSFTRRLNVSDMAGNLLFCIRRKQWSGLHGTLYGTGDNGEDIFEVRSKHIFSNSKLIGTFTTATGQKEQLMIKGNWRDSEAEITDVASGQMVAAFHRDRSNARELPHGQCTYNVNVASNVDMAIIVALCLCLDLTREVPAHPHAVVSGGGGG
ncbi:DUF567-domain-containing protein [Hypoxylon cercidicola]|nr:DUF567-domain-containing protein [Hypoxylon cercidicola]